MDMEWLGPGIIAIGAVLAIAAIAVGFLMREKTPPTPVEPKLTGREKDLKTIAKIKGSDRG